ncbi:MPP6 domain-containing protein [Cephalotus follicularis]|uniref:MPP6 domain-containing protein n=1 Tax=Cephalotus follicularis TaxID=3775 RepID=A0A1Q3CDW0_CEPFO|nr:MPP6 domain-containing protein [Cephalotus follicularis]
MAKRELSSTLRNLKFMQRATVRDEKSKKEEEVKPDGNFSSPSTIRKCVVIMEGDPHPGAAIGRMSFRSFNPSIDKLNEEAANPPQPEATATSSGDHCGKPSLREDRDSKADTMNCEANEDLKRKQSEVASKSQYPDKSPKNVLGDRLSSPSNGRGSFKKPKHDKLDWSVLRPSKSKQRG